VSSKRIVIKDACIFIDLIDLGLLDHFYQIEIDVITTSFVVGEISDDEQLEQVNNCIGNGSLMIEDVEIDTVMDLQADNSVLTIADCSVLALAMQKNAIVLSSDKPLRNASTKKQLEARGMLWVIEELESAGIITIDEALQALQKYPEINIRAPKEQIQKLVEKLNSKKQVK
jgi:rRNA-processing protein FCF1